MISGMGAATGAWGAGAAGAGSGVPATAFDTLDPYLDPTKPLWGGMN
jgi:hypothetical protein